MKWFLVFAVLLGAYSECDAQNYKKSDLKEFSTDGCSGVHSGTKKHPHLWLHCCIGHDYRYWAGGTEEDRKNADLKLKDCFTHATNRAFASANFVGARLLGGPSSGKEYRWGYGWPIGRGYAPITQEERGWIKEKRERFPCRQQVGKLSSDPVEVHRICKTIFPEALN